MSRTMVVTGKTSGAHAVVLPMGCLPRLTRYIAYGTYFGTLSTAIAPFCIHSERAVGYPMTEKKRTEQVAVNPWPSAAIEILNPYFSLLYHGQDSVELIVSIPFFLLSDIGFVQGVDQWKDVRLGHDDTKDGVQQQSGLAQVRTQIIERLPHIVSARRKGIGVMRRSVNLQTEIPDKLSDDEWRTPSMHGKTKTDALVWRHLQPGTIIATAQHVGYRIDGFVKGFGQGVCQPTGVTRTRKIENHNRFVWADLSPGGMDTSAFSFCVGHLLA